MVTSSRRAKRAVSQTRRTTRYAIAPGLACAGRVKRRAGVFDAGASKRATVIRWLLHRVTDSVGVISAGRVAMLSCACRARKNYSTRTYVRQAQNLQYHMQV